MVKIFRTKDLIVRCCTQHVEVLKLEIIIIWISNWQYGGIINYTITLNNLIYLERWIYLLCVLHSHGHIVEGNYSWTKQHIPYSFTDITIGNIHSTVKRWVTLRLGRGSVDRKGRAWREFSRFYNILICYYTIITDYHCINIYGIAHLKR